MKLKDIKRIVYGSYRVYLKRETHDYIGYCCKNKSGSMIVSINAKLNGMAYDLVLKHELGHIYYRHFENMKEDRKTVRDLIKKKINQNASISTCHKVINISQDIVIHDTILDPQELEFLVQLLEQLLNKPGLKLCTSELYDAPPLLSYPEYFEYVINKMFPPPQIQQNQQGQIDQDGNASEQCPGGGQSQDGDPIEGDVPFDEVDETDSETEANGGELQDSDSDGSESNGVGIGKSSSKKKSQRKDPFEKLTEILKQKFYRISSTTSMAVDSFRKYSKMNLKDGILRKSIRLKDTRNITRFPVILFVDNSGSMGDVINSIISTIIECNEKKYLHKDSTLVLCSTQIDCDEKLVNITEMPIIDLGGTDMSDGLKSSLEKYPKNQFIVISDFQDGNGLRFARIIHESKDRITTIICSNKTNRFGPYMEDFDYSIY